MVVKNKVLGAIPKIFIASSILMSGYTFVKENTGLKEVDNVEEYAEKIDCDLDYVKLLSSDNNTIIRLKHNYNNPIYVGVSNEFNDEQKGYITESLDYVFGVVNKINSKYKYEIIPMSKIKAKKLMSESFITIEPKVMVENGLTKNYQKFLNLKQYKNNSYANIYLNTEELKTKDDFFYVTNHELSHVFGFGDVYFYGDFKQTDKFYSNTITYFTSMCSIPYFTPNDYKSLWAMYDQTDDDKLTDEYFENIKHKCTNYAKSYYENVYKEILDKDLCFPQVKNVKATRVLFNTPLQEKDTYFYEVLLDNNKYTLNVTNHDGELLETTTGNVIKTESLTVLQDVNLNHWKTFNSYISSAEMPKNFDITLFSSNENNYAYTNFDLRLYKITSLENQNQEELEM